MKCMTVSITEDILGAYGISCFSADPVQDYPVVYGFFILRDLL